MLASVSAEDLEIDGKMPTITAQTKKSEDQGFPKFHISLTSILVGKAPVNKPKKRRHKIRYPKGFDPANPEAFPAPDPERWLPKNQRSDFKKKHRKKQGLFRGPQGSTEEAVKAKGPSTAQMPVSTNAKQKWGKKRK